MGGCWWMEWAIYSLGQESQNTRERALMFIETPDGALGKTLCCLRGAAARRFLIQI